MQESRKNECVKIIGFKTFVNQQKHCMNEIVSSVEIIEHKLKMSFHINVMKQIQIYAAVQLSSSQLTYAGKQYT